MTVATLTQPPGPGLRRHWASVAVLTVASLAMAAPLLWTLLLSLKSNDDLLRSTQSAFSAPYTLQNYTDIVGHPAVFGWLLNSSIVSLAVTVGVLALSSLAGYAFAQPRVGS
jgi:multiple sugar transport system permease protein